MKSYALRTIETETPKALEYLAYAKAVFEKLPDDFEFEWETVPVSCHHLTAIIKRRFSELVEYHGYFEADGFIKARNGTQALRQREKDNLLAVEHSWLWTADQNVTLDAYPVGYSEGPMLVHGFVKQPLRYGRHCSFLHLRTPEFAKQVDLLWGMLETEKRDS